MTAKTTQLGAIQCSKAVSNALKQTCSGVNAYTQLSVAAATCAQAMTKVYVKALASANSTYNAMACSYGCVMAQSNAGAFSVAAANAIAANLAKCSQLKAYVGSKTFSAAWVDVTTNALIRACVEGHGMAYTAASVMTSTLAKSLSKVLASVLARACACNKSCLCPPLPKGVEYGDVSFSDSASTVTAGKYALNQAVGDAAAQFCDGKSVASSTKTVLSTMVGAYVEATADISIVSQSSGQGNACTMLFNKGDARSIASASSEALTAAFANNFNSTCGPAVAGLKSRAYASDFGHAIAYALKISCSKNGTLSKADLVKNLVDKTPLGDAVNDALTAVKNSCACKGKCWCGKESSYCKPLKTCEIYN